ncbi:acetyl-CoA synthetase-like protein [Gloeophyllum trabeum ATCC 11539]|uniref:Acetyl-CoA synthetase-like protein n=1 Tax=Gloeophyllum trabeum (strain ATCC 11539 / FP-39264 / Madison 617) TaxID=670483 RepID=S7PUX3_GLOTA|nr:acetyl-CoA synthetase-like protein [Gloeophyllum trabeum ATCC 11539]EPQ51233.1 acetyl-CoA synthetase-like protein [Gloeophyllum trabeum ATCC 11539]
MFSIPQTQGLNSRTFRVAPFNEERLTLPQVYEWHLQNSPEHPIFVYYCHENHVVRTIRMKELVHGMYRAAAYIGPSTRSEDTERAQVVGILAASDSITFFATLLGVIHAGHVAFPISPRNSPAALAHLLVEAQVTVLLIGREKPLKGLADAGLSELASQNPDRAATLKTDEMPVFEDLFPPEEFDEQKQVSTSPSRTPIMDDPAIMMHSSGSTRYPKPIPWSHRGLLMLGAVPFFGHVDLTDIIMGCHTVPMFHSMGIFQLTIAGTTGITLAHFQPSSPAVLPTPTNVFNETKLTRADLVCSVPAFIEKWSQDMELVAHMKTMKGVIYGGGPLNRQAGDLLASHGVAVYMNYGCTEGGPISAFISEHPGTNWEYVIPSPHLRTEFVPFAGTTFELVLLERDSYCPAVINTKIGNARGYATGDLFEPHPSVPNMWRIHGRADDQIMLSTGEKTNPGPLESIICQDPNVRAAVIFGRGRTQNGVIIEPANDTAVDYTDEAALSHFRNLIWPSIERANEFAPQHSRIFKEAISSSTKPFTYTAKNTPRRQAIIASYQQEIDALYETVEVTTQRMVSPPEHWDSNEVLVFVRRAVLNNLDKDRRIRDDEDLFDVGGSDSLRATWIRNTIIHAVRNAMPDVARRFTPDLVYQHPTISSLATAILESMTRSAKEVVNKAEKRIREIKAMLAKYSGEFPTHVASPVGSATQHHVVLLTGSTGGFGCEILDCLLRDKSIARVYALNRLGLSSHSVRHRQVNILTLHGIQDSILSDKRLVLIPADLHKERLGLGLELYAEIRDSVTHIIHNAWRVDFNLSLASFESNIRGLRNLIDLALSSSGCSPSRLIFVSSIGLFANIDPHGPIPEGPAEDCRVALGTGYSESKWVAERLLSLAAEQASLPVTVVRLGQLTGARNGYWSEREWFPVLIKSALSVKCLPMLTGTVSWLPPEVSAAALVELCSSDQSFAHLVNPKHSQILPVMERVSKKLNVPLVPYQEWLSRIVESYRSTPLPEVDILKRNPALRLLGFFKAARSGEHLEPLGTVKLDTRNTVTAARSLDEDTRELTEEDVDRWMRGWFESGFLQ